ncbi:MAG: hemolysin family protein [Thermodesulfovibrionales bacterium]|nr:hemolysin family protein [Thermodesulfovibrionales bacterium]
MWLEIFLIFLFILINGFFAASEIAVVTVRKSRIKKLLEEKIRNAEFLNNLREHPDQFLATIQIGVTAAGALASAVGGSFAVTTIGPIIKEVPISAISSSADFISIGLIVFIITYLSLVFGELIPKSLALANPERVSLFVSPLIVKFSKLTNIFVYLLTTSTNFILKPLGKKAFSKKDYISEEEVKLLLEEGRREGVFESEEKELIHGVFEFTDTSVKEIMVPSPIMVTLRTNMSFEEIVNIISEEKFSRYPLIGKDLNDIRGIVYAKEFLNLLNQSDKEKQKLDIRKATKPALFIPETMKISNLLREMQKKRVHMAIVIDEYGAVTGLVTLEDILEEIVGEIRDEHDTESPVIQLPDNSFLIDPSITINDLRDDYSIAIPESTEYETLGGFIVTYLQRIPKVGDFVMLDNMRLQIIEMVGQRIAKVKLEYVDKDTELS